MKARESGMPDESTWAGFFSPQLALAKLGLTEACCGMVDFGCGYGTFTIAAARVAQGIVYGLDIDHEMIHITSQKAQQAGLTNVELAQRDFATDGTGLPDRSVDYAMLFNILHCEQPETLLQESYRVLSHGGRLGIMHWNYDPSTPRGPSMDIRPRPEQCREWAEQVGFKLVGSKIELPPYHYGWVLQRP